MKKLLILFAAALVMFSGAVAVAAPASHSLTLEDASKIIQGDWTEGDANFRVEGDAVLLTKLHPQMSAKWAEIKTIAKGIKFTSRELNPKGAVFRGAAAVCYMPGGFGPLALTDCRIELAITDGYANMTVYTLTGSYDLNVLHSERTVNK